MDGKQLKISVLQYAIQGKLLPQNENDEPAQALLERVKKSVEKNGVKTKARSSFHDAPVEDYEKFFPIPESWCWCRLGNLCLFLSRGKSPSYSAKPNLYPVFAQKCNLLTGGISLKKARYLNEKTALNWRKEFHLRSGDVLVNSTGTGTVCRTRLFDESCLGNFKFVVPDSHVSVVRTDDLISSEYLTYLFNTKIYQDYWEDNLAGSTNQKELYIGVLQNTPIPLPPLNEQIRIVEQLKQILPLVNEYGDAQQQLDSLNKSLPNNLKKSILQEAVQGKLVPHLESDGNSEKLVERIVKEKNELDKKIPKKRKDAPCKDISDDEVPFPIPDTWRWIRLSSMAVMYTGNSINENEKLAKYTNVEGLEYIGTKDVGFDHKVNYKNGVAIPSKYIQDFKIAPANSVLLCIEGGSAGRKICVIDQDVCFGNKLCCFTTSKECVKYLYYYLQSPLFFDVFRDNKTGIIGGVGVNTLKELLIPIPPLAEQKRIVKKIEDLFKAVDSMNLK